MRTEGAGKGDALRKGVNWKKFGENYDAIFRKKKRMKKEKRGRAELLAYYASGKSPVNILKGFRRIDVHASDKCGVTLSHKVE